MRSGVMGVIASFLDKGSFYLIIDKSKNISTALKTWETTPVSFLGHSLKLKLTK
jgi:hypothetical protein